MNTLRSRSKRAARRVIFGLCGLTVLLAPDKLFPAPRTASSRDLSRSAVSDAAYPLLTERVTANRASFFVYQDADSGLNHGFPSGFFGSDVNKIHLDAGCIDDSGAVSGCSADRDRLDRVRGTILRVSFDPLSPGEFVGVNIEEPENFGYCVPGWDMISGAPTGSCLRSARRRGWGCSRCRGLCC